MDNRIEAWLSSGTFDQGVKLYNELGKNSFFKKILISQGNTEFTKVQLRNYLMEMREALSFAIPSVPKQKTEKEPVDDFNKMPELVKEKYKQANLLYQENAARLSSLETLWRMAKKKFNPLTQLNEMNQFFLENESERLANEILDTADAAGKLYAEVEFWRQNGILPEERKVATETLDGVSGIELIKRRNVLRSQISKQKNNPERATEVEQWKLERDAIQAILHGAV